jgi:hypothetical protein
LKQAAESSTLTRGDRFGAAADEYKRRYPEHAAALTPAPALLMDIETIPTTPPPSIVAGFALGNAIADAEARCTKAGLTWQPAGVGAFACSGSPADLGIPAKVTVTACGDRVCGVTLDAGADGATWKELAVRYGKLVKRLLNDHGSKTDRSMRPSDDCTKGISGCFAEGRVRTQLAWRWPQRGRVVLTLGGRRRGGPPSLRVEYATDVLPEKKD